MLTNITQSAVVDGTWPVAAQIVIIPMAVLLFLLLFCLFSRWVAYV